MNARAGFEALEIPRSLWLRYLSAVDIAALRACVENITQQCTVIDVRHPRSGLALMQLRDSALGDCFYMGEIPWSRAHVRVQMPDGTAGEGAAEWMDDRSDLARCLAILDAVLAHRLEGWLHAHELLLAGQHICQKLDLQRQVLMVNTRVDFKRLDENDD